MKYQKAIDHIKNQMTGLPVYLRILSEAHNLPPTTNAFYVATLNIQMVYHPWCLYRWVRHIKRIDPTFRMMYHTVMGPESGCQWSFQNSDHVRVDVLVWWSEETVGKWK